MSFILRAKNESNLFEKSSPVVPISLAGCRRSVGSGFFFITGPTREIYWLIGKHSFLSLENKFLIYKTVLKPVWTYGIELLGCATKSNIAVIQRYQSKLLRTVTNAPWYVSNQTLHSDLHIPHVHTVFRERAATHNTTLDSHPNPLMEPLVHPPNNRRLKRRWTFGEIH